MIALHDIELKALKQNFLLCGNHLFKRLGWKKLNELSNKVLATAHMNLASLPNRSHENLS